MIIFNNWQISVTGLIARQYDNLSRRIDVTGDLPEGFTWRLLVQCGSNADTILLTPTDTGVGAVLTADNLSVAGEYEIQLKGTAADGVTTRHTNIAITYIPRSMTGVGTWPEVPTEFAQIEQRCTTAMIAAESAAKAAKADADLAAALAAEVAEKAAQTAQDATESAQAKDAAQTAQRLADEAQSAAEAARNAAETAQAAAEQSANDAVGAKQGAEAALKAAQDAAAAADQALADLRALYQEMQTWAQGVIQDVNAAGSIAVQSVQSAGDAQVQRVTDEGTTQTANAKAQADAAAQSAQQAAESAAVYDDVVADVNQLKQDVAAITPDDTTVDGKPWTSKKIVDSLCMPFEETGNPVQVYPVENYPLGVKVSWEPVQEGSGDPSPDNIRPITGRDTVSVTRCGKNLVNIPDFTLSVDTNNRTKHVNVNAPAGTYTLSLTNTKSKSGFIAQVHTKNGMVTIGTFPKTFTLENDVTHLYFYIKNEEGNLDNISNIQLELGSTATPYEPYTGDTYNIALPETVYGGEADAVSSEVAETWGLVTLDGTEGWRVDGKFLDNKTDWYYVSSKIPNAVNTVPNKGNDICSHYPHADVANNNTVKGCAIVWGCIRVRCGDTIPDNADAWKAYLAAQYAAGTPVQVAYKLAEPVPFTATGAQPIPALSGVNTLYTDADGVIVTGAEDPKHTITELKNAIISLGGNI